MDPAHYTVLRALAEGRGMSLSAFVREAVVEALDLEGKMNVVVMALADLAIDEEAEAVVERLHA